MNVHLSAEYTCNEERGALLVLNSSADSETIYDNRLLKRYMVLNHHGWHSYARNVLGLDIKPQDVVLIVGWHKTRADWANAVFINSSTTQAASLQSTVGGNAAGLGVSHTRQGSHMGPQLHRQGQNYEADPPPDASAEATKDQSAFVKRYRLLTRLWLVKKLVAGAGYHQLPDGDPNGKDARAGRDNGDEGSDEDGEDEGGEKGASQGGGIKVNEIMAYPEHC